MSQREYLGYLTPHHLKEVAALRVQDAKTTRDRALKALERYEATGCGLDHAQKAARLAKEAHQSALRGLEALTQEYL